MADSEYSCTLDEEDLKRAKKELNEDPRNRLGAVRKLREWIEQQPHITFPTDTATLLMYLRHAKFSQLRAREVIEKTCKCHTMYPNLFKEWTLDDPDVQELFKSGFIIPLPGRGEKGQRRILFCPGSVDLKKSSIEGYVRFNQMVLNYFLMDESVQVCGMEHLIDLSGLGLAEQKFFAKKEMKIEGEYITKTLPLRIKGYIYYNCSAFMEIPVRLFFSMAPKKIRDRLTLTDTMERVYKSIPMECLPREYLPDDYDGPCAGTRQQLLDEFIEKLGSPRVQTHWDHLSARTWGLNKSKMTRRQSLAKTFRKLSVM